MEMGMMHYNTSTYIWGKKKKKIFQIPILHTYIPNNDSLHKKVYTHGSKIYNIALNVNIKILMKITSIRPIVQRTFFITLF
jgi:hypothetical protein